MKKFEHARAFAESHFKKQERQFSVSQKAAAEHEAAVNANTVRLRALRLTRDQDKMWFLKIQRKSLLPRSVRHDCTSPARSCVFGLSYFAQIPGG
jgi:hypothetical protein